MSDRRRARRLASLAGAGFGLALAWTALSFAVSPDAHADDDDPQGLSGLVSSLAEPVSGVVDEVVVPVVSTVVDPASTHVIEPVAAAVVAPAPPSTHVPEHPVAPSQGAPSQGAPSHNVPSSGGPSGGLAPVVDVVAPVVETVADSVAPVVAGAVPVSAAAAPVVGAVAQATAPVTDTLAPLTDPVTALLADVLMPVLAQLTPVLDPVTDAVAPVLTPIVDAVVPSGGPVVPGVGTPLTPTVVLPGSRPVSAIDPPRVALDGADGGAVVGATSRPSVPGETRSASHPGSVPGVLASTTAVGGGRAASSPSDDGDPLTNMPASVPLAGASAVGAGSTTPAVAALTAGVFVIVLCGRLRIARRAGLPAFPTFGTDVSPD